MSLRNLHKNQFASKKKQQGFLLPLAVFIVVVMGLFALVLSRNTIQTNTSSVQEAVSVQAFYAAESGAQRGMQHLFYLAAPTTLVRQQVDQRCINIATNTPLVIAFKSPANPGLPDVPGLNNCSIALVGFQITQIVHRLLQPTIILPLLRKGLQVSTKLRV
jgi:hypothetical protein